MIRAALLGLVLVVATVCPTAAATLTDRYSSFWVFGDSLSDPGNLYAASGNTTPPSPPYFNGRFSNGPVWAESVTVSFLSAGRAAGNYAFGGATAVTNADQIPDFATQTHLYGATGAPVAGSRPLASVFFGANDILDAVAAFDAQSDALQQVGAAALAAADAVGAGVQALAQTGVRDFAIWDVPDIGLTPRFQLLLPQGAAALGSYASSIFNAQLGGIIAGLTASGLNVTRIDTTGLFAAVVADPAAYGLGNTTLPCLFPDAASAAAFGQPQLCDATAAAGRLFFDTIHPNAVAHQVLAANFAATVAPVPLPATGPLLIVALGLVAIRRRTARAFR